jgi:hypothetical protein
MNKCFFFINVVPFLFSAHEHPDLIDQGAHAPAVEKCLGISMLLLAVSIAFRSCLRHRHSRRLQDRSHRLVS